MTRGPQSSERKGGRGTAGAWRCGLSGPGGGNGAPAQEQGRERRGRQAAGKKEGSRPASWALGPE